MAVDEKKGGAPQSFFNRLFSILFSSTDPEKEKRKILKEIGRQFKKQRFKFYKPKGEEAQAGLAKFFYEIYKVLGPAQIFLENARASGVLKSIIIESALDNAQKVLMNDLSEEAIRERAKETESKLLAAEMKEKLIAFFSAFDAGKVKKIEHTHMSLINMLELINFDYYFLLKKFDSSLPERDFIYNPRFESINGDYVSEDLKDFLSIIHHFNKQIEWQELFDVLNAYKSHEVIGTQSFKKMYNNLEEVRKSGVLELMVRHIDANPYFKVTVYSSSERIVEEFLNKIRTTTEITMQKILKERQNQKIDKLLHLIFGTTAVSRLKYYTEKANIAFSKKMLGGFIYTDPLNYLKAFLLDYFKRDIREIVDVLLIRGKWAATLMSQQLSESFHVLMEISSQLILFDESLSEEGEQGIAIKNALKKSERDKNAGVILRQLLKEKNDTAKGMINESAQALIVIGKNLKLLIEDYDKHPHEVIMNWRAINSVVNNKMKSQLMEIYRKVYYFVQLLQFYVKKTS